MANNKEYITKGPLWKSIIRFAIPIMIASIVQNLFHSADMVILGNMADSTAVASVGATGNIIGLVVQGFIALSFGTSVLLCMSEETLGTLASAGLLQRQGSSCARMARPLQVKDARGRT